jgi:hypothetical protein
VAQTVGNLDAAKLLILLGASECNTSDARVGMRLFTLRQERDNAKLSVALCLPV